MVRATARTCALVIETLLTWPGCLAAAALALPAAGIALPYRFACAATWVAVVVARQHRNPATSKQPRSRVDQLSTWYHAKFPGRSVAATARTVARAGAEQLRVQRDLVRAGVDRKRVTMPSATLIGVHEAANPSKYVLSYLPGPTTVAYLSADGREVHVDEASNGPSSLMFPRSGVTPDIAAQLDDWCTGCEPVAVTVEVPYPPGPGPTSATVEANGARLAMAGGRL